MLDLRIIRCTHKLYELETASDSYLKHLVMSMGFVDSTVKVHRWVHLILNYFVDDLHTMLATCDRNHVDRLINSAAIRMHRIMKFIINSKKYDYYTPRQINMIVRDLMWIQTNVWRKYYGGYTDFTNKLIKKRAILEAFSYAIYEKVPLSKLTEIAKQYE